jgi:type II secretory pathway component PulL
VVGDMFDIAWRANRRNYKLLTGSVDAPRKVTRRSWWFLALMCVLLMVLVMVPTLLVAWLSVHVFAGLFGMDIHMR